MTHHRDLSRRTFLRMLAAGAAVIAGGLLLHREITEEPLADRLRSLVPHVAGAAVLGRAYLARVPTEAHAEVLLRALAASLPGGGAYGRDLGAAMNDAIRRDFAEGHMIELAGWYVSVTEGRLAAFVAGA